jgi:hypothetical protein
MDKNQPIYYCIKYTDESLLKLFLRESIKKGTLQMFTGTMIIFETILTFGIIKLVQ